LIKAKHGSLAADPVHPIIISLAADPIHPIIISLAADPIHPIIISLAADPIHPIIINLAADPVHPIIISSLKSDLCSLTTASVNSKLLACNGLSKSILDSSKQLQFFLILPDNIAIFVAIIILIGNTRLIITIGIVDFRHNLEFNPAATIRSLDCEIAILTIVNAADEPYCAC
jgi:hypothetical protein